MSRRDALTLVIWAATIPLIPYTLLRRHYNALAGLALLFLMLLIDIFIMLNTPNPDHVIWIRVVE
jgi:hypothetical protein